MTSNTNPSARYVARWVNKFGEIMKAHSYATRAEATDCIMDELKRIQDEYEGTDTERLAKYIADDYEDAIFDFETVQCAGFAYSVTQEG